jgi:hypothetical protein
MPLKMTEVLGSIDHLTVDEKRKFTDDYVELVLLSSEASLWTAVLEKAFGPAMKPAGKAPAKEDREASKLFGGVWKDQTLYQAKISEETVVAVLWPWQDDAHVTLKMAAPKS